MKTSDPFFALLGDFVGRLEADLMSPRTVESYKDGLKAFHEFLRGKGVKPWSFRWSDLSADTVREFTAGLVKSGSSIATRNARLIALKRYIGYAGERCVELLPLYIDVRKIKCKPVRTRKDNWLSEEHARLLLSQTGSSRIGVRDHCLLLFMLSTGARLAEVESLTIGAAVLGERPYVRLKGKGGKPRNVPLPDSAASELSRYIKAQRVAADRSDPVFFCVSHGREVPMSRSNIQRIVAKYEGLAKERDGTFPDIHPHVLRHTYAARLYRKGLSLPEIATLLGHECIDTTEIYADTDLEMVEEALSKITDSSVKRKIDALDQERMEILLGIRRKR